jgi:hypothetical protein
MYFQIVEYESDNVSEDKREIKEFWCCCNFFAELTYALNLFCTHNMYLHTVLPSIHTVPSVDGNVENVYIFALSVQPFKFEILGKYKNITFYFDYSKIIICTKETVIIQ